MNPVIEEGVEPAVSQPKPVTTSDYVPPRSSHSTLSDASSSQNLNRSLPSAAEKTLAPKASADAMSTPASYQRGDPFETDLEAMIPVANTDSRRRASGPGAGDCQVWPGKEHWKQKAKAAKRERRSCKCMAGLSRRTRIVVKIAIGLFIVGVAVGVGFGVSKPLGAPIWGKKPDE